MYKRAILVVATLVVGSVSLACGGDVPEPYCFPHYHYCIGEGYCCAPETTCGTDDNGCGKGFCCPIPGLYDAATD